jgi:xanthine dehydrogenase accessory factor
MVSTNPSAQSNQSEALALTPGGGKIGSLLCGTFDSHFTEIVSRKLTTGRLITLDVSDFESVNAGLPANMKAKFLVVPAVQFSPELWPALLQREAIALVCHLEGDEVREISFYNGQTIASADSAVVEIFNKGVSTAIELGSLIVSTYWPVTKLVIAGSGPIAEAISKAAQALNWQVAIETNYEMVAGLMAGLSKMDCAIIMGHDVESSSRCLASALESNAGYIGALGSMRMQENRADWLAYRDIIDLSRVHGPAGFDIGAKAPAEIAISVLAEAIAVLKNS